MKKLILIGLLFIMILPSATALTGSISHSTEGMILSLTPTLSSDVVDYRFVFKEETTGRRTATDWIPVENNYTYRRAMDGGHYGITMEMRDSAGVQSSTSIDTSIGTYPIQDEYILIYIPAKQELTIFQQGLYPVFDWFNEDIITRLFILFMGIVILSYAMTGNRKKQIVYVIRGRK